MPFSLDVLAGTVSYNLTAGTPFRLERAEGFGLAPVRRLGESGPLQDGDSDLGYRLDPRVVTLSLSFSGTSDASVDTARSLLTNIASPKMSEALTLRLTREDGNVRYLDCNAIGATDFPLQPIDRASKTMRAVLQLRAPNPLWYEPAYASSTNGTVWYTANSTIRSSSVLESVEFPTNNQQWTYSGTTTGSWTIAFASEFVNPSIYDGRWAFGVIQSGRSQLFRTNGIYWEDNGGVYLNAMIAGTATYMQVYNHTTGTVTTYRNGTTLIGAGPGTGIYGAGTARRWRNHPGVQVGTTSYWPVDLPKAAVYDVALDESQRAILSNSMLGTSNLLVPVRYIGDMPEYPILVVQGSANGLVVTNSTTGQTITFGTSLVMGSADSWRCWR